ncbi:hypothetical protein DSD19_03910 [Rhodovulum sp. BSW8]|nr:hypothetical protein DSD19_03910 [Rhodovulum sp. BSW8]
MPFALTEGGFDAAAVAELIAASDLPEDEKALLTAAAEGAADAPVLVPPVVAQIRAALGY